MACNTARLAGLDNRKGRIERGFDADFVVWDPEEEFVVRREDIRLFALGHSTALVLRIDTVRQLTVPTNRSFR